ncbi:DUF4752 family protein [Cronobacter dublinensis]|uniref:DUF4752 family protein n=1 Tax=Cronobacter dublinensis TaxID=413497 RepID=UPI00300E4F37
MNVSVFLNTVIALVGWAYITAKASKWLCSIFLQKWEKSRRVSRRQRAVNELYDAFELSNIEPGNTVRLALKGGLVIMMYRQEEQEKKEWAQ